MPIVLDGTKGEVPASWTTAGRPASPSAGQFGYNTTLGTGEMYTSAGWVSFPDLSPIINSVSGGIYTTVPTTLTLSGTNFGSSAGTVNFVSGATTANVSVTPASSTTISVAVPSTIYALGSGVSVVVSFTNYLGKTSNGVTLTISSMPSGGTVTIANGYRYHTFSTSGTLSVTSGYNPSANVLIVAGGGSGGGYGTNGGGGGGAGGYRNQTVSLTTNSYSIVIGAGGAPISGAIGNNGNDSSAFSFTSLGGGAGGRSGAAGASGGSGGGNGRDFTGTPASGTSGQGYAGGIAGGTAYGGGGGGGGAGAVGFNGGSDNTSRAGTLSQGGVGLQWLDNNYYAGGGGGAWESAGTPAPGGLGGGGSGSLSSGGTQATSGTANTGGGGGGGQNSNGGTGGSGIVIVRYLLPT